MAGFGGFKVISVDYRMPPDFPFPAALDDAVAVYRTILQTTGAKNIGIFGTSAGGSLTITSITADLSDYSTTTTCPLSPATLAAGKTCTVSVFFTPTAAGAPKEVGHATPPASG